MIIFFIRLPIWLKHHEFNKNKILSESKTVLLLLLLLRMTVTLYRFSCARCSYAHAVAYQRRVGIGTSDGMKTKGKFSGTLIGQKPITCRVTRWWPLKQKQNNDNDDDEIIIIEILLSSRFGKWFGRYFRNDDRIWMGGWVVELLFYTVFPSCLSRNKILWKKNKHLRSTHWRVCPRVVLENVLDRRVMTIVRHTHTHIHIAHYCKIYAHNE